MKGKANVLHSRTLSSHALELGLDALSVLLQVAYFLLEFPSLVAYCSFFGSFDLAPALHFFARFVQSTRELAGMQGYYTPE